MKKTLIINAHPLKDDSFCTALANRYKEGAEKKWSYLQISKPNRFKFRPCNAFWL